ncbi:MAG TPA: hypothetical protein VJ841_03145 [Candidatus Saccharimonadales bacterium]|nr:hypothetical protein [Candidatus Saccharimonadales bacterium]
MTQERTPIIREDDGELLGFIEPSGAGWQAETLFGYLISRTVDRAEAERVVREQGLSTLMGVWNYFDTDDQAWHPCVIKEASEQKLIVIRTNFMGYEDPDDYKHVVILNPNETKIAKT